MRKIGYPARIWRDEEGYYQVRFPDVPGVITYGETLEEAKAMAQDALNGVIGSRSDRACGLPEASRLEGPDIYHIRPHWSVMLPLVLRGVREEAGLSQEELAARLDVSQQAVQKMERPGGNLSIKTAEKIARALGRDLDIELR